MATVETVHKLVAAYESGNREMVIKILADESRRLDELGNKDASKRLQMLARRVYIPHDESFQAQGLSATFSTDPVGEFLAPLEALSTLEPIILSTDLESKVTSLVTEWESKELLALNNLHPTNKVLLYGEPGTGKTLLAMHIAKRLKMPIFTVQLDSVISSYLGQTGKNIREIFNQANSGNVVIFLDEFDAIAKKRTDERELGEVKRIVNVLLQRIDTFPNTSLLIAATNHEDLLDKAIWRRFPFRAKLPLPNELERKELFKSHLVHDFYEYLPIDVLVDITNGMSGSAIRDISQQINKLVVMGKTKSQNDIVKIAYQTTVGNVIDLLKVKKDDVYTFARLLKSEGFSLKQISEITKVPYTTLRDNMG